MKTYEVSLTTIAWTELLGGETSIYIDIRSTSSIGLCFWENGEPSIDAPIVTVKPTSANFDFQSSGLPVGQKIYARAIKKPVELVVVR